MSNYKEIPEEEMTVTLTLDDDIEVTCEVITIFSVGEKDYIALLPKDTNGQFDEDEVWIYGYKENPDDPNEEPELIYIDDDEEYEAAEDAFDEFLDNLELDDME